MYEVRGSGRECQAAMAQEWPRGATPHPRSGGAAERSYTWVQGQGRQLEGATHAPTPEARGGSWEDQPHVQRAMAARAQESLEELYHVEGQEGQR